MPLQQPEPSSEPQSVDESEEAFWASAPEIEESGPEFPAYYLGKPMVDVIAAYGQSYQLGELNAQYIHYQTPEGGRRFYCAMPEEWGRISPKDIITYISVNGQGAALPQLQLGMSVEEVEQLIPLQYSYDESMPRQRSADVLMGSNRCALFLMFDDAMKLTDINLKLEGRS